MDIINPTPYPHFYYIARDKTGRRFGVCIMRGYYSFSDDGKVTLCNEQPGPILSPVHYGDPCLSSVRFETDLAPAKPSGEAYIADATAVAPDEKPSKKWGVSVTIGTASHSLTVTGPRRWVKRHRGDWQITNPDSCQSVDIRYELAYGGIWKGGTAEEEVFQENPVGVGFVGSCGSISECEVAAPQIESSANPVEQIGRRYYPEGFGAINRAWLPRRELAGTFDDKWKKDKWPLMPNDFSNSYYSCSPLPLQLPRERFFRGDEECRLNGFHARQPFIFKLPDASDYCMFFNSSISKAIAYRYNLDTVLIQINERKISLVWRVQVELRPDWSSAFIAPLSGAKAYLFKSSATIHQG